MQGFSGIGEKLKRANENIINLNFEIERFFKEGEYPVIPENDRETLFKAIHYHKNRVIPPRFSVLSGEIVHHFRSCFDHIIWIFSDGPKDNIRKIEFPVFEGKPLNSKARKCYQEKIHAVTNKNVLTQIERLQPYNAADPIDDPLLIIHNLDIVDKHRELVMGFNTGARIFPISMQPILEIYEREHPEFNEAQMADKFKAYGILQPVISFRDFGRREVQPVPIALMDLFNYTSSVVDAFKGF